jgi:non-ribosomal peptide synthetase-like protein
LAEALQKVLPGSQIALSSNFFDDLGGDSLLAACWVSALRGRHGQIHASIRHIYEGQTIEKIASLLDREESPQASSAPVASRGREGSRIICGVAQAAALVVIYGLLGMLVSSPYLFYSYVRDQWESVWWATAAAVGAMVLIPPMLMSTVVSLKWIIIGKIREGDYPVWGLYYFRLWLVRNLLDLVPARYLAGTPLYRAYWRSLGCRVGRNAWIGKVDICAPDLVSIGSRASVGSEVLLETMYVENGTVRIRKVTIGNDAYVGTSSVLGAGAEIGAGAELGNMSFLERGASLGAGDRWEGAPARMKGRARTQCEPPNSNQFTRLLTRIRFLALASLFPIFALIPFLPALILLRELDEAAPDWDFTYLYLAPVFALSYVLIFALILFTAKWLVQGKTKTGRISVFSMAYLRKWFVDQIFELSLDTLHSLFATLYLPPLYRLLGAKIGSNCEISTATSVTFDLLEVGEESFIADNAVVGDPEVSQGWMELRRTKIGRRAFLGNSSLLPDGTSFPDNSLLGVLSLAPPAEDPRLKAGTSWLGVPAIPMLGRRAEGGGNESRTFHPSLGRRLARLAIEGARIIISPSILFVAMVFLVTIASVIWEKTTFLHVLLIFPFLYLATVAGPVLVANLVLKWTIVGRYVPGKYSMWSFFVWRTEAITAIYEATAVPLVLFPLCGTPFLPWVLRLFGVKIGKNCFIDTTDFTEFDMVRMGDGVTLNRDCGPQTHLFEDRVMKVGAIELGNGVTLGSRSVVLLETKIGDNVSLRPLSLVMRGESLPSNSRWVGSPASLESSILPTAPGAKQKAALAVS